MTANSRHRICKRTEDQELQSTAIEGDWFVLDEEAHGNPGSNDCGIAEVYDSKISQQEIHRCVEPGIRGHCHYDEEVAHDSGCVDKQEHQK